MTAPAIELLPKQKLAMSCPVYELMYGGQKGGGKSYFLVLCPMEALAAAHRRRLETGVPQPQCRVVVFRKNLDDLDDLLIKMRRVYPVIDPEARFNQNDKKWTFSSGATVEVAHLDGPEDHEGWNGQEITVLLFDQVEQISYDVYSFLMAQVRSGDEYYKPFLKVRSTANPGGKYGDWVHRRFIQPAPLGNEVIREETTLKDGRKRTVERVFIPAALSDNRYLNDDGVYEANMRATLPDHLLKMYLEGDWNVVVGAFFSSRITPHVHFVDSFPIPGTWDVGFGLDWGSTAPAATVFCARDSDGVVYAIDEHVKPGITGRTYGESLLKKVENQRWSTEKRWTVDDFYGLIDPQATGRYGSDGASAAAGIASWGFRLFPANKDRKSGVAQILERLALGRTGKPRLVVFRDRCPHLVRQLSSVRTDPRDPEDYDLDDHADAVDALRFKLVDWPVEDDHHQDPRDAEVERWERYLKSKSQRAVRPDESYIPTGYG